jgi:hypothetical protein
MLLVSIALMVFLFMLGTRTSVRAQLLVARGQRLEAGLG